MKFKLNQILVLTLGVILLTNASSVKSKGKKEINQKYQCQLISRSEAIRQAKSRMEGKVVGIQLSEKGERSVYRVRMLINEKRIKTLSIQACK